MKIKGSKEALAWHLGWDIADLKDCQYQPGRTTKAIYTIGDDYYTCIPLGQSPPKATRNDREWDWAEIKDNFVNYQGYKIFKQTV